MINEYSLTRKKTALIAESRLEIRQLFVFRGSLNAQFPQFQLEYFASS